MSLFEKEKVKVYGEEHLSDDNVEYSQVSMDMERFDLGEPQRKEEIRDEYQEQVTPDIINPDGSIDEQQQVTIDSDNTAQNYAAPEMEASSIQNMQPNDIDDSVSIITDMIIDGYDENDYVIDDDFSNIT